MVYLIVLIHHLANEKDENNKNISGYSVAQSIFKLGTPKYKHRILTQNKVLHFLKTM